MYDFIRNWGWPAMLTALTWFAGWFKHAPMWQVWGAVALVCLISYAIAFYFSKRRGLKTQDESSKPESCFELEGIPCDMPASTRYVCQIRVRNNHPNKSADNVQVELMEMESFEDEGDKPPFKIQLPWMLLPENHTGTTSINPGAEKIFTLFDAGQQEVVGKPTVDEIYDRVEAEKKGQKYVPPSSMLVRYFVMCSFKNPDHVRGVFFEKNKNYRLKIKVTAHDFPPTYSKFNLNFTGKWQLCRFTLTNSQETKRSALIIHSAIYGIEDSRVDVTEIVRAHLVNDKLVELASGNHLGGDPFPGTGKVLTIDYSIDGKRLKKSIPEGQIVRLP